MLIYLFIYLLLSVGGKFVLHSHLDITMLPMTLSPFYKQCFDAWSDLNNKVPLSFQEIVNEIIWNNKFLCVDKKSVFRRDLFSIGLLKIGDLLSCNNTTTFIFITMNLLLNPEQSVFVMSIIDSIPAHWHTIIKDASSLPINCPVSDVHTIIVHGNSLTIFDVSSKQISKQFQAKK